MHEAALAQELVDIIQRTAEQHGVTSVNSAVLELGRLTCVDPETLEFAFLGAGRGTVAEGCRLIVERTPLIVSCPACGREGRAEDPYLGCPGCGGAPVEVLAGREMRLLSLDVEEPGDA
jgi:hydrogenase nickel incorporation protein HypA/HybF